MKKEEKQYYEKYGDVSRDLCDRIEKLLPKKLRSSVFDQIAKNRSIEWKTIRFMIYMIPKATPRPKHNREKHIFYVKGAKGNKERFQKFLSKMNFDMIYTPTKFKCLSYFPTPTNMNTVEKIMAEFGYIYPISKPDFDNLAKTYSDMIQGSLIYDDAQIIEGISKKFYSIKPRIEIEVSYMAEFDSEFNRRKVMKHCDIFQNPMRDFTKKEAEIYQDSLKKIYKPSGTNIFHIDEKE